jgi:hypothetical protein
MEAKLPKKIESPEIDKLQQEQLNKHASKLQTQQGIINAAPELLEAVNGMFSKPEKDPLTKLNDFLKNLEEQQYLAEKSNKFSEKNKNALNANPVETQPYIAKDGDKLPENMIVLGGKRV